MKDDNHIVKVDVAGFNFHASTMKEVTEFYKLNIFQQSHLRNTGELIIHNGKVILTYV